MSFQAYLDAVEARTGHSPEALSKLAEAKGLVLNGAIADGVKPMQIVDWLKADYGLGHGHAMSMVAWFKGKRS
ncbi:MAG TPA: DUF4287 domain-containing protein [Brevundimonas sp.]